MSEREILHNRFLNFFNFLEEQAELSKNPDSKQFNDLADILGISKKTLLSYLKSEHLITHLEAYIFCEKFGLNLEEMFVDIPNYKEKLAEENDLSINTEINAVGGDALPVGINSNFQLTKIVGIKGGSLIINVIGDSMSPDYNEGERVVLEKVVEHKDIRDNQVYVFALEDGTHKIKRALKTFSETGNLSGFVFISTNPKYKKEHYSIDAILVIYRIIRKLNIPHQNEINKSEKNRQKLKDIIGQRSEVKKVLELLRVIFPKNNDIIVYQSQYNQNLRDYRKGEIEVSSRDRSNARILTGILEFIDEMQKKDLEKIDDDFFE